MRAAAMADVIGVLTSTHISALQSIETALGGTFMGLAVAARTAKRANRLSPKTCRRLERLDLAMHVARHATAGRMAELLDQVATELSENADASGPGQFDRGGREPAAELASTPDSSEHAGEDPPNVVLSNIAPLMHASFRQGSAANVSPAEEPNNIVASVPGRSSLAQLPLQPPTVGINEEHARAVALSAAGIACTYRNAVSC